MRPNKQTRVCNFSKETSIQKRKPRSHKLLALCLQCVITYFLISLILLMDGIQVVLWSSATGAWLCWEAPDRYILLSKMFLHVSGWTPFHLQWSPITLLIMAGKDLALSKHSLHSHNGAYDSYMYSETAPVYLHSRRTEMTARLISQGT